MRSELGTRYRKEQLQIENGKPETRLLLLDLVTGGIRTAASFRKAGLSWYSEYHIIMNVVIDTTQKLLKRKRKPDPVDPRTTFSLPPHLLILFSPSTQALLAPSIAVIQSIASRADPALRTRRSPRKRGTSWNARLLEGSSRTVISLRGRGIR